MRAVDQWGDMTDRQRYDASHRVSDKDSRPEALHHTLGTSANQAMPGAILENIILPSSASGAYSQSDMQTVINALKKMQGNY